MQLKAGDVFCVEGSMGFISCFIRFAEKIWSIDNRAQYGHAGIITDTDGTTLEVLWTVKLSSLRNYSGQKIIIARPTMLYGTELEVSSAIVGQVLSSFMQCEIGRPYPIHRLFLHLIPPLAKYISIGRFKVCSELVAEFLKAIGARPFISSGVNPDTLADMFIEWKNFDVIYEGIYYGKE